MSIKDGAGGGGKFQAIPNESAMDCQDMLQRPATENDAQTSWVSAPSCRHLEAQIRTS